jgi:hypothetical protein
LLTCRDTRSLPLARLIFVAKRALHAAPVRLAGFAVGLVQAQCLGMMNFPELASVPSNRLVPFTDQLWLAVAAYLARFKGSSREHTESDLRCYLAWYTERGLDPLAARRPHLEL